MYNQLLAYLQKELQENPNAKPRHLEWTFGFQNDTPLHDPSANWPMLDLPAPFGNIRIGGRIDRIDDLDDGWMVIDYKTGILPKKSDIETGLNLQLPIYVEAVSRLTQHHCLGGMFQRITHGSTRKFSELEKPKENAPSFEEQRKQIMEKVVEYVEAIRRGHFDTLPVHDCPGYCPFRRICRYSPARAEFKSAHEESVHE
jgi:RecB family exonuclease